MPYKDYEKQKAECRRHYHENPQYYKDRARARDSKTQVELRALLFSLKDQKLCTDCGIAYPHYVMQFDHLRDKLFDVSTAVTRKLSVAKLLAEVAKCELVCANCHATRTYLRRNSGRSSV
jgi:hypothetical protein